jgi:hypothetical protein
MSHEPPFDEATFVPPSGRFLTKKCPPKVGGLAYAPDVLYFHFVGLGQVSDWQPFVITNTGPINIGIGDLDVEGMEFELQGNVPTMLQPDESVILQVRFRPTGEGARLGNIIVEAGEEEPQPKIRLIGIGGELKGGDIIADPTLVGDTVDTLIMNRWAYRYGSFAVADILPNEILLDYHVTSSHTLQPNFAGSKFSMTTPPAAEFILTVYKGATVIGQITLNPDGTIEPVTTGGLAIGVPIDSIITVRGPGVQDETIGRVRMTFVGVVPNG